MLFSFDTALQKVGGGASAPQPPVSTPLSHRGELWKSMISRSSKYLFPCLSMPGNEILQVAGQTCLSGYQFTQRLPNDKEAPMI